MHEGEGYELEIGGSIMLKLIDDLRKEKTFIIIVTVIFFLGIGLGVILQKSGFQIENLKMMQNLEEIAKEFKKNPTFSSAFFHIFTNNFQVSLVTLFLGLCIFPVSLLIILLNGGIVGFIVMHAASINGMNPITLFVTTILPHGIFEIPAIIISAAIGIHASFVSYKLVYLRFKQKHQTYLIHWKSTWKRIIKLFLFVVLLLLVAAIIEATLIVNLV